MGSYRFNGRNAQRGWEDLIAGLGDLGSSEGRRSAVLGSRRLGGMGLDRLPVVGSFLGLVDSIGGAVWQGDEIFDAFRTTGRNTSGRGWGATIDSYSHTIAGRLGPIFGGGAGGGGQGIFGATIGGRSFDDPRVSGGYNYSGFGTQSSPGILGSLFGGVTGVAGNLFGGVTGFFGNLFQGNIGGAIAAPFQGIFGAGASALGGVLGVGTSLVGGAAGLLGVGAGTVFGRSSNRPNEATVDFLEQSAYVAGGQPEQEHAVAVRDALANLTIPADVANDNSVDGKVRSYERLRSNGDVARMADKFDDIVYRLVREDDAAERLGSLIAANSDNPAVARMVIGRVSERDAALAQTLAATHEDLLSQDAASGVTVTSQATSTITNLDAALLSAIDAQIETLDLDSMSAADHAAIMTDRAELETALRAAGSQVGADGILAEATDAQRELTEITEKLGVTATFANGGVEFTEVESADRPLESRSELNTADRSIV